MSKETSDEMGTPDLAYLDNAVRVTEDAEIKGLTSNDLQVLNSIVRDFSNYKHKGWIPSMDIVCSSGITGRLVWKPRMGYLFVPDVISLM